MSRPALAAVAALALCAFALSGCSSAQETPVRTDHVTIPGAWAFDPKAIEVPAGTTVTWTNHGGQTHSVTFDDGSSDQDVAPGASVTVKLDKPGTYHYHCKYHPPGMVGTVVVD